MLLSYSTWGMPTVPIDEAVAHCAGLGFDGLELTVIPGWITDGATLNGAERQRIRTLYDDHHLDLCGLCANTTLLDPDPAAHALNESRFRTYLEIAADVQAPGEHLTVSTTSGGAPAEWDASKGPSRRSVRPVCGAGDGARRRGGMEPHVGAAIHRPDQVLWLLDQIRSAAMTVHFDISHFNVQGMDMDEMIAAARAPQRPHPRQGRARPGPEPRVSDSRRGGDGLPRYLRGMEQAGYTGHIVVEVSIMVQRRPGYDALAAATQSYQVLAEAFTAAGTARTRVSA